MKNSKGFSLLELLIVVAIILIIATIAIPSLLRSRQAANESAAVANLRTINTAEVTYLSSSGGNYGDLPALVAAGLLDDTFIGTATLRRLAMSITLRRLVRTTPQRPTRRLPTPVASGITAIRMQWSVIQRTLRLLLPARPDAPSSRTGS